MFFILFLILQLGRGGSISLLKRILVGGGGVEQLTKIKTAQTKSQRKEKRKIYLTKSRKNEKKNPTGNGRKLFHRKPAKTPRQARSSNHQTTKRACRNNNTKLSRKAGDAMTGRMTDKAIAFFVNPYTHQARFVFAEASIDKTSRTLSLAYVPEDGAVLSVLPAITVDAENYVKCLPYHGMRQIVILQFDAEYFDKGIRADMAWLSMSQLERGASLEPLKSKTVSS